MDQAQIRHTFHKSERLCSQKQIGYLFQQKQGFICYPCRVIWAKASREYPLPSKVQIAFSVPKKRFKRAVTRNLIKRRLREAWRLNKHTLYDKLPTHQQLMCIMVYVGKEVDDFDRIQKAVNKSIERLVRENTNRDQGLGITD